MELDLLLMVEKACHQLTDAALVERHALHMDEVGTVPLYVALNMTHRGLIPVELEEFFNEQ